MEPTVLKLNPFALSLILPHVVKDEHAPGSMKEGICFEPSGVAVGVNAYTMGAMPDVFEHKHGPELDKDVIVHALGKDFRRIVKAALIQDERGSPTSSLTITIRPAEGVLGVGGSVMSLSYMKRGVEVVDVAAQPLIEGASGPDGGSFYPWRQMLNAAAQNELANVAVNPKLLERFSVTGGNIVGVRPIKLYQAKGDRWNNPYHVYIHDIPTFVGLIMPALASQIIARDLPGWAIYKGADRIAKYEKDRVEAEERYQARALAKLNQGEATT